MRRITTGLMMLGVGTALLMGCHSPKSIVPVKNVERAATTWKEQSHICLEYATPGHELDDKTVSLAVPVGEKNVSVSYENSESLASMYSVTEIMQFGHASLYRLCEASGNEAIDEATYERLFGTTLDQVHSLIELQLLRQRMTTAERLVLARADLRALDEERCELAAKKSSAAARELRSKNQARRKKVEEIEQLQTVLGAEYEQPIPTEAIPTPRWIEEREEKELELDQLLANIGTPTDGITEKRVVVEKAETSQRTARDVAHYDFLKVRANLESSTPALKSAARAAKGKYEKEKVAYEDLKYSRWRKLCKELSQFEGGACSIATPQEERCPW